MMLLGATSLANVTPLLLVTPAPKMAELPSVQKTSALPFHQVVDAVQVPLPSCGPPLLLASQVRSETEAGVVAQLEALVPELPTWLVATTE
jgi:hypothetical protein